MEFLKQQFYPPRSNFIIKKQYKTDDELYVVTFHLDTWRLHTVKNKQQVMESKDCAKIAEYMDKIEEDKPERQARKKRAKIKAS